SDLVENNTPVLFHRDPLKFPDLNHAVKRDPRTNLKSNNNKGELWTSLPESVHQVSIGISDRGVRKSYRNRQAASSHAYSMINDKNERVWVKFHMRTQQGIKTLTDEEGAEIIAKDRDSHQRDLYNAIENGDYPKWKMYIQVMTEEEAN